MAGLAIAIILTAGLNACQQKLTPTAVLSTDHVTITFACRDHERIEYQRLAKIFHEAHPTITVQVLSRDAIVGHDQQEALRKLAIAVDTFTFGDNPTLLRSQKGLLRDLSPFIKADRSFQPGDFYPGTLDQFQWDEGTWGVPARAYPILVYYDKAAFDAADMAYPRSGWTFEDFTATATRLVSRQQDEIVRYGLIVPWGPVAATLVLGRAGRWTDKSISPSAPALNTPTVLKAMRWYTDLALNQGIMPNPTRFSGYRTLSSLIDDGKAAMWVDYLNERELDTYRQLFNLGVAPLPEGSTTPEWVWAPGYLMSAGTAHPQESWRWLSFLSRQRWQLEREIPPARRSVAEATAYWNDIDEERGAVYRYILEKRQIPISPEVRDALTTALDTVLARERGAEEALAEAQAQAVTALGAMNVRQAPPQPVFTTEPRTLGEKEAITFCQTGRLAPYREVASLFHEAHPEIAVEIITPRQYGFMRWADTCDCFVQTGGHVQIDEARQRILNVQPFVDADPDFPLDDFFLQPRGVLRWQRDLWGLPADIDVKVMFYNKDLFDEAGVAYPQPGWNLDDFLEKAVALTEGEGETRRYGYTPLNSGPADLMFFMEQRGASLLDAGGKPIPLDAPQMIEALRWYTNLVLKYGVMPPFRIKDELGTGGWRLALEKRSALVSTRRAAMWTDYPGNSRAGLGLSYVGTAPLPLGTGGRMTQNKIWGYFISADTSHPEACWQWIKFLTGQPAVVRGVPPRRSLLEAPEYRRRVGEEALETYRFALEHGDNRLWEEVNPWLYQAFDVVMDGAAPEQALAEAQRKYEAFQACVEGPSKLPVENLYNTCGKEVDPNFYVLH